MTLTAIDTRTWLIVFPERLVKNGSDRDELANQLREGSFICPHCYQHAGLQLEVKVRNADDRRLHFFHTQSNTHKCSNYSSESEKHLVLKAHLQAELEESGFRVQPEQLLLSVDSETRRRPDLVAVSPAGETLAYEVQLSPITFLELKKRTEDHKQLGCDRTVWVLGLSVYHSEHGKRARQWLHDSGMRFCKAFFQGSSIHYPAIEKGQPPEDRTVKPRARHLDGDRCGKKLPEPDANGIRWVYVHNGKMWSFYAVGQLLDLGRDGSALIEQSGLGTRRFGREAWRS